jgi:hypothetical protein
LARFTLAFALQLKKKHGKTSVRVAVSKNDFKSVCHIQNKLTNRPPTKLKETQITLNLKPNLNNKGNKRRRP